MLGRQVTCTLLISRSLPKIFRCEYIVWIKYKNQENKSESLLGQEIGDQQKLQEQEVGVLFGELEKQQREFYASVKELKIQKKEQDKISLRRPEKVERNQTIQISLKRIIHKTPNILIPLFHLGQFLFTQLVPLSSSCCHLCNNHSQH